MAVSTRTYEQLALEDLEGHWELFEGRPRRKPAMTQEHNTVSWWLANIIQRQVDPRVFQVRVNSSRTNRSHVSYFIPDVVVIPRALMRSYGEDGPLETYDVPLPFVAEVWSRSTGDYDVDQKFPEYQRRGDLEIWRVHPYERTVTAWRRRGDGGYVETTASTGELSIESLPSVSITLAELFEYLD